MGIVRQIKKLFATGGTKEIDEKAEMNTARVSEIHRLHSITSAIIPENSPLEDIITRFTKEPGVRGVFLVDSQRRFTGLVTRIDLLRWAHLQLFGGKGRHEITVSEFYRIVDARKAIDLCSGIQKALSVKENDSLQEALNKMLDHEEDVLPVLDSQGEIVGDLRLSEVLWWALAHGRRKLEGHE
jgi:CBS domain-containing protein